VELREGEEEEVLSGAAAEASRSSLTEEEEGEPEVEGEEGADKELEGVFGRRVEGGREEGEEGEE